MFVERHVCKIRDAHKRPMARKGTGKYELGGNGLEDVSTAFFACACLLRRLQATGARTSTPRAPGRRLPWRLAGERQRSAWSLPHPPGAKEEAVAKATWVGGGE